MITGALVMGLSYMLYGVLGSYALFPNNDPNATTQNKSTGAAIIFVICVSFRHSSLRDLARPPV